MEALQRLSFDRTGNKKPPEASQSLNYGFHPGVLPRDPHLLQLPQKYPCICSLSFLVQFAELEQFKLKLSRSGAGEEFEEFDFQRDPTRPSPILSYCDCGWLGLLWWAPILPGCPNPSSSQTLSCTAPRQEFSSTHLVLLFGWSPSAASPEGTPGGSISSGKVSVSREHTFVISSLVELVSIEVTVIDGIWADMLTRPVMILMAILAHKCSLFAQIPENKCSILLKTLSSGPCSFQLTKASL